MNLSRLTQAYQGSNLRALGSAAVQSKIVRDTGAVTLLRLIARLAAFWGMAYAMRAMGPEQLGVGAFVVATVEQLVVVGSLGLNITGVRQFEDNPLEQDTIASLVTGIRFRAAIILSLLMVIFGGVFQPAGTTLVLWLVAVPYLVAFIMSPLWLYQSLEKLPLFMAISLMRSAIAVALYFSLFQPGATALLYVMTVTVAEVVVCIASYWWLRNRVQIRWWHVDLKRAKHFLIESRFAYGITLTTIVFVGLDMQVVALLLSPTDGGIYRAAAKLIAALWLVMASVQQILYPRLFRWRQESREAFIHKSRLAFVSLVCIGCLISLSALIWVPVAFTFFLGPEYSSGIMTCILLVVGRALYFVSVLPQQLLLVYEKDNVVLWISIVAAVSTIIYIFTFAPLQGLIAAGFGWIAGELLRLTLLLMATQRFRIFGWGASFRLA